MDKKQRLKLKTLDSSILSKRSEYSTDSFTKDSFTRDSFTRDSSIMIPPKITTEISESFGQTKAPIIERTHTTERIFSTNNSKMSDGKTSGINDVIVSDYKMTNNKVTNDKINNPKMIDEGRDESSVEFNMSIGSDPIETSRKIIDKILPMIKSYWLIATLASVIVYLILKPSEYKFLLDEIENLKKENTSLQTISRIENIADISLGTSVISHSDLYSFGFFKIESTDPNSILEPGSSFLSLKEDSGFFEIEFKGSFKIRKIALYHPEKANPKSAIRQFSTVIKGNRQDFEYCGKGYEEFLLDELETDKIKIEFTSNYGESLYTSIYRVFIFS